MKVDRVQASQSGARRAGIRRTAAHRTTGFFWAMILAEFRIVRSCGRAGLAVSVKRVVRIVHSRYNRRHEYVDSNYWLTKLKRKATAKGALRLFLF